VFRKNSPEENMPMALTESALSELLAALQVGEGVDLVRELACWALQQLIETEAAAAVGAGRYERSEGRVAERNGHRPKVVSIKAGDLNVKIPKLSKGSFFPSILEPRRRIDQALYAVVMEAYVSGVSTRAVDDLVAAMGIDTGISRSEVSRICAGLDERVAAFRNRTLGHVAFPYVYLDATYVHVRDDALGQVVSRAVVVATAITATGEREVLGVDIGDSEDETFWTAFLRSLRTRGLSGVRLVISDAHAGLCAAIRKTMAGASWQRCRVHYARNLLATVQSAPGDGLRGVPVRVRAQRPRGCHRPLGRSRRHAPQTGSPRPPHRCVTPASTSSRSPRSPASTGARSGRTTRSNGSTRRSSAAPTSWGSSPTTPPPSASSAPCSPTNTTNGPSPAATSPKHQ
jgi:putative transposase